MARQAVDQCSFTQGQLDPRVQSRTDWDSYYKAAKEITNCLVIPQGGVTRRWGTRYTDVCTVVGTDFTQAEISTMIYNDNIIYLMLWEALSLKIYFQNLLIATVVTQYTGPDIQTLRFSQIQTRVIITTGNYKPQQLIRSPSTPATITATGPNNSLVATIPYAIGTVLPVQFSTTGTLPATNPQIFTLRDYFILITATNNFQIFSTPEDAFSGINFYTITNAGVTSSVIVQNSWAISDIPFKNYPSYDFNGGYFGAGFTFTPSATSGTGITLTASAPIFTAQMVGGVFEGNGGIMRFTAFTSTTVMVGYTEFPFTNTNAIQGILSYLSEPAFSPTRGWPRTSSSIQNSLLLAGTASLANATWKSVINDVYNFDDTQTLADNAISYYPASGTMSYVQSMTSCRSLLVHTNTGTFSTPVQNEVVLSPANFVLNEQNKFGIGKLQPVFIDNQVFFIDRSGNNLINMIWDFTQGSYKTDSVSIKSSSLIVNPIDMAAFSEPNFIDGFYVLFVNSDGTLCVTQTLYEQQILAFSLSKTNTYTTSDDKLGYTVTPSSYVKVNCAQNDCWFLVDRTVPIAQNPVAITGFSSVNNTLLATAHGMVVGMATLVTLSTTGSLPTTVPLLTTTNYFWAVASDANNFRLYLNQQDASLGINVIIVGSAGINSNIIPWLPTHKLFIEAADFTFLTDSSIRIENITPQTVITGLSNLNGQVVQVVADGFVLQDRVVFNGQITIERPSLLVNVGLRYQSKLVPLPAIPPPSVGGSGILYNPRHVRNIYVNYYNTIGSQIQGYGIPVIKMQDVIVGAFPTPRTGVFEYALMEGWAGANPTDIQIVQEAPLPMTILALSYVLEI